LVPSEKGKAGVQEMHSLLPGPEHVAQLSWHGSHVSGALAEPPEHVQPSAMVEQATQADDAESPSSHTSSPTRRPSPHTVRHTSLVLEDPPEQKKPGSTSQEGLQPSPAIVLLSSHNSRMSLPVMRRPSPQTGVHSSRPPTPSMRLALRHVHPRSMLQNGSQPSPPSVELSSHCSAVVRIPLPQTCTTCANGRSAGALTLVSGAGSSWSSS